MPVRLRQGLRALGFQAEGLWFQSRLRVIGFRYSIFVTVFTLNRKGTTNGTTGRDVSCGWVAD